MPQRLRSGWVVATGHKRSNGDAYLLAQYEGPEPAREYDLPRGVSAKGRRTPILGIRFTRAEWERFLEGEAFRIAVPPEELDPNPPPPMETMPDVMGAYLEAGWTIDNGEWRPPVA